MNTSRISRVTRRRFLKGTGLTLAAAGAAPVMSAPFVSRAHGRHQDADDGAMESFRSGVRQMVRQVRQGLGNEEQHRRSRSTTSRCRTSPRARPPRRRPDRATTCSSGTAPAGRISTGSSLSTLRVWSSTSRKARQDQRHRQADRLQPGRQDLVCVSRLLHQFPGHVPQEPVGRDRGERRTPGTTSGTAARS